ncbi:urate oxidase [Capsaspora owczarzaki ATCC 30864]|uniref:Uricase n=1 Tax=Capsaspora owczarzaki (strain ATCC 30864) TaxID=595528 RepID=A0A0D2WRN2_CAPO3|nr:urate oxidase [Capsaspora owczarzaki ATCC 30864]KJE94585.1 urate oxidase [Capsaspora owczarzaki ATCC 30864]|eukprot:XP_004346896.1 urate oxidase [Capsaspora owczarzaki ATCC 30864]
MSNIYLDDRMYGKADVRLLHVRRETRFHHVVHELRCRVLMRLASEIDFVTGDNRDIVATDTTKNTVFALAKKVGVTSAEQFALAISKHYFDQYKHIEAMDVSIDETRWTRVQTSEQPKPHSHAFINARECVRTISVTQTRGQQPVLTSGIKELEIMKTTQSGFEGYIKDEYTTLKPTADRVFRTVVSCQYTFDPANVHSIDYEAVFQTARDAILSEFAGPSEQGVYSPSVQNTIYLAQKRIIDRVAAVSRVTIEMPNRHCILVDLSPFKLQNNNEVFVVTGEPAGLIRASMSRLGSSIKSKL